jgi:para-nitrobenzyl esterase
VDTIASTRQGRVEGREKEGVLLFAGIPYAAAPVGPLRFAPPGPHPGWSGIRPARRFGNAAPQLPGRGLTDSQPKRMGEDCLVLNVTTPALDDTRRPVLVWIHGGGFRTGQAAIPWYNGASFAARGDIVTVSINYRLGALGFANLSRLGEDATDSGLSGILDQIAALEWVRDNIAAFGGDPQQVTLAGESAGAMSVGTLLGCPAAAGLFHRAIAQSGAAHHSLGAEVSQEIAALLCRLLEADDLDALRAATVEQVLDAQRRLEEEMAGRSTLGATDVGDASGMPFQPSVGCAALPRSPLEAIRGGAPSAVPLLIGTNRHETTLWDYGKVDEARLRRIAGRTFGDPETALASYRDEHPGASAFELLIALTTDQIFRIPALRLAEAHCGSGGRSYHYLFSWESRAFGGRLRSCHALEIPFTFNNLSRGGVDVFLGEGPLPQDLADAMHAAWIAFIRTGSPNGEGLCEWPAYDTQRRIVMEFGERVGPLEDPGAATRAVWEGMR